MMTLPTASVVSLAEAKAHLRILDTSKDAFLTALIPQVEGLAEQLINRSLSPRNYELFVDNLKANTAGLYGVYLPKGPATAITAVHTFNADNTTNVVPAASYYQAGDSVVFITVPNIPRSSAGLRVQYVGGYTTADPYKPPNGLKEALLKGIHNLYWNPGGHVVGHTINSLPLNFEAMLVKYRRWRI